MRILIIEDEEKIAKNISKYLQKYNFICDLAVTGKQGFEMACVQEYDVVLLDWMLPDISGVEVCKQLRNESLSVPILFLTARGQIEDKLEGFDCGADDYMTKPFNMDELLARLRALVRRKSLSSQASPSIQISGFEINTNSCSVKYKNKILELAPKEYALLEYLALNKCKVLNRMEILEHVWGDEIDPLSNTVDVHIRYLRQKLEPFRKAEIIKTVKNKGYMLCED